MQDKLIIFINAHHDERVSWIVMNEDSTIVKNIIDGDPQELAELALDKEVIVVVPMEDVLLVSVSLPKMNDSRFLQAVPYTIEDQLVAEPEVLHFALGKYITDTERRIAIVAQEKIKSWLNLLKTWSLDVSQMIPAVFALPHQDDTWTIWFDGVCVVRQNEYQGFACDFVNLEIFLQLALEQATIKPKKLHIYNNQTQAFSPPLQALLPTTEDFISAEQQAALAAHEIVSRPNINLLQGRYAVTRSLLLPWNKIWRIAAQLSVVWVFVLFLYPTISYFILRQRVNATESEITQIYKRNFPQANSVIAPKQRMQDKLNQLNNLGDANQPFLYLGYLGKALMATPNIQLKRLDYQNNQITLELMANTSQDFSAFTDFLNKEGLSVKQQNADLANAHINATLLIE